VKTQNHYKMGLGIQRWMSENGMALEKSFFIFGNLYPDLCLSYFFRRHEYPKTAPIIDKLLYKLYFGKINPDNARFSFYLGVITHYICDYFCYPHTTVFRGGLREHYMHEKYQAVDDATLLNCRLSAYATNFTDLKNELDVSIYKHEQMLLQNIRIGSADIPQALYTAARIICAIYASAYRTTKNVAWHAESLPVASEAG